jgi:hypothetical protein
VGRRPSIAARRLVAATGLAALLGLAACGQPPARPGPTRTRVAKGSVFGDAALVPTREGERARRELATAGQIERAIATLPIVAQVTTDVGTQASGDLRAVVVVALRRPADDAAHLRAIIDGLAASIAGGPVHVVIEPPPPTQPAAPVPWLLVLGLLGLGVSLGVAAERLRGWPRRR